MSKQPSLFEAEVILRELFPRANFDNDFPDRFFSGQKVCVAWSILGDRDQLDAPWKVAILQFNGFLQIRAFGLAQDFKQEFLGGDEGDLFDVRSAKALRSRLVSLKKQLKQNCKELFEEVG